MVDVAYFLLLTGLRDLLVVLVFVKDQVQFLDSIGLVNQLLLLQPFFHFISSFNIAVYFVCLLIKVFRSIHLFTFSCFVVTVLKAWRFWKCVTLARLCELFDTFALSFS